MANLDMEPLNIMGDWYQVERSLPLSRYYFLQKKTQMFQIFGNLDITKPIKNPTKLSSGVFRPSNAR